MHEIVFAGLALDAWITLAVVLGAIALMLLDRVGPDLVMFGALCILVVAGVVEPKAAMAGFADTATATVAVLFVVARAVEETGSLTLLASKLYGRSRSTFEALARFVVPTTAMSAFLNNTPLVAMLIPVANGMARRNGVPPSKFLMPLSYAAILGGTCTLVGTSTNLVVAGLMSQSGMAPMGMFEISWVGVPTAILGIVYLLTAGNRLIPERTDPLSSARATVREYLAEVEVARDSPLVGRTVEGAGLRHLPGLFLAELRRSGGHIVRPVAPEDVLQPGDHLVFTGQAARIQDLATQPGLVPTGEAPLPGSGLYEVVVSHASSLIGRTVRDSEFRRRFDAAILAVHRAGERIEGRIGDIALRAGDTLMLTASPGFDRIWRDSDDFYLASEVSAVTQPNYRRAPLALAALALMVIVPTVTSVSMLVSGMGALLFLLVTGCITPRVARESVNGPVLLLIASAFGVSAALEGSGLAQATANSLQVAREALGPVGLLAAVYLSTMLLTELISNAAAVALVFPIAVATAEAAGLDVRPFCIAITMAASASFATPIGYQTNLMVYGPGGYRFGDFLRVGGLLNLVCFAVSIAVIPMVWPLDPAVAVPAVPAP